MAVTVTCPTCSAPVEWSPESPYRPFCSRRCKLIDLGEWLQEERRIPGERLDDEGLGSIDDPAPPANDD
jgi:endogenous inhibitor of DNA gyrase (YacG/DUF329 family)